MPEPLLTREEEVVLAARILSGDHTAIEELVRRSARIQNWMVAKAHLAPDLTTQERAQACATGAIEAAMRFDPRKGRFSGYCFPWMEKFLRLDQMEKTGQRRYTPGRVVNADMSYTRDGGAAELERERVEAAMEAERVMECLSDRERELIKLTHGFGEGKVAMTLVEAGAAMGISLTRAYQLKKRAMRKMRRKKI
jgi:RNA polymerase sigma factor (sigma-70 family)